MGALVNIQDSKLEDSQEDQLGTFIEELDIWGEVRPSIQNIEGQYKDILFSSGLTDLFSSNTSDNKKFLDTFTHNLESVVGNDTLSLRDISLLYASINQTLGLLSTFFSDISTSIRQDIVFLLNEELSQNNLEQIFKINKYLQTVHFLTNDVTTRRSYLEAYILTDDEKLQLKEKGETSRLVESRDKLFSEVLKQEQRFMKSIEVKKRIKDLRPDDLTLFNICNTDFIFDVINIIKKNNIVRDYLSLGQESIEVISLQLVDFIKDPNRKTLEEDIKNFIIGLFKEEKLDELDRIPLQGLIIELKHFFKSKSAVS